MAKSKKLSDREIAAIVDSEVSQAMGGEHGGELSEQRAKAMDYYLAEPFGNEQEGRSKVVLQDVAEVVDNIMPSLLRIFTTADNVIKIEPVGKEDVQAAEQETDLLRYVFWKQNEGFMNTYNWLKDGLLQKNGIIQCYWDESETETREEYEGLSEEELGALLEDDELEAIEQDVHVEIQTVLDPMTGMPQEVEIATYDITFTRTTKTGKVTIDNVPPEEFLISTDAVDLNPSHARFVGRQIKKTRQELLDEGYPKKVVMELPATDSDSLDTEEEIARMHLSDESFADNVTDELSQEVEIIEAYRRIDADGDGTAELRQVIKCGSHILSNLPVDRQPFHSWTPVPMPHKHYGLSLADKVMDIQLVKSTLLRQMLDNLYLANQPRKYINENAIGDSTIDDLLSSRIGGLIRVRGNLSDSIQQEVTPFVGAQAFPMMEFFDDVKKKRTGVSDGTAGLDIQQLKNVQTTVVAQAYDMAHMQIEVMARIFAETGLKSLFLHMRELLRKHQDKEMIIRLRGEYVPVIPSEWRDRSDLTVTVGLGNGTREQRLIHLNAIKEMQAAMIGAGGLGLTVTPKNVYNTADEFCKNALMPNTDLFFQNPDSIPPEQQQQILQQGQGGGQEDFDKQLLQVEQQVEMQKNQLKAQEMQMKAENDRGKLEVEAAKLQLQAQQNQLDQVKQQIETEKAALEHERAVNKLNIDQQNSDVNREKAFTDMQTKLEELTIKLTELELKYGADVPGSAV